MGPILKKLLEQVESWPEEDQEELAELAREIEARRAGVYKFTEEERVAVEQGLREAGTRNFASDEEVTEIFKKARSPRK
jgi:hypothetical protein